MSIVARDWREQLDGTSLSAGPDWGRLTTFEVADLGLRAARAAWPGGRDEPLTLAHAAAGVLEAGGTVLTR